MARLRPRFASTWRDLKDVTAEELRQELETLYDLLNSRTSEGGTPTTPGGTPISRGVPIGGSVGQVLKRVSGGGSPYTWGIDLVGVPTPGLTEQQVRDLILNFAEVGNVDNVPSDKIPDLDADKIATGVLHVNRIPVEIARVTDLFSGDYHDLDNLPTLFSGNYNDLTNKPSLFSGDYNDLVNLPTIRNVPVGGTTGQILTKTGGGNLEYAWRDVPDSGEGNVQADWNVVDANSDAFIRNKPSLFSGEYSDLLNIPSFATVAISGSYNDLTGLPTLFSGDYNNLANLPTLFSGNYADLQGLPTLFDGSYNSLTNTPTLFDGNYGSLANRPILFSGSYNDLTDTPDIRNVPTGGVVGQVLKRVGNSYGWLDDEVGEPGSGEENVQSDWDVVDSNSDAFIRNKPTLFSGSYNDLTGKPTILTEADVTALFYPWTRVTNNDVLPTGKIPNLDASKITSGTLPIGTIPLAIARTNQLFDGDYGSLTNTPTLFSGNYEDLINLPVLFDGDYGSLSNLPTLFSGSYSDLTGTPIIRNVPTGGAIGNLLEKTGLGDADYGWAAASALNPFADATEVSSLETDDRFLLYDADRDRLEWLSATDLNQALRLEHGQFSNLTRYQLGDIIETGSGYDLKFWIASRDILPGRGEPTRSTPGNWWFLANKGFYREQLDTTQMYHLFSADWYRIGDRVFLATQDITDVTGDALTSGDHLIELTHSQIQSDWDEADSSAVDFILNKPTLFDGDYDSLANLPTLFSGNYTDLTNLPVIRNVPVGGSVGQVIKRIGTTYGWADDEVGEPGTGEANVQADWDEASVTSDAFIRNKPSLFSGAYTDLTGLPTLFDGSYNSLSDLPILFDGDYDSLQNLPSLFDGDFDNLTDRPRLYQGELDLGGFNPVYSTLSTSTIIMGVPATTGQIGRVLTKFGSSAFQYQWVSLPDAGENNVQPNWDEANTNSDAFIRNKPTIRNVPTGGTAEQILTKTGTGNANYNWRDPPDAGDDNVQSDWTNVDPNSDAFILNKPTLFSGAYADLTGKPTISLSIRGEILGRVTFPSGMLEIGESMIVPNTNVASEVSYFSAASGARAFRVDITSDDLPDGFFGVWVVPVYINGTTRTEVNGGCLVLCGGFSSQIYTDLLTGSEQVILFQDIPANPSDAISRYILYLKTYILPDVTSWGFQFLGSGANLPSSFGVNLYAAVHTAILVEA